MKYLAALALLAAACTVDNPFFVGGGSDGGGSQDLAGRDGGGAQDGPEVHPDLAKPACTDGERHCAPAGGRSEVCSGGAFVTDRNCPEMSMCSTMAAAAGYCAPPPMSLTTSVGAPCDVGGGPQENQCFAATDLSCEPFVVDAAAMTVKWVCDKVVNTTSGFPGAACTKGSECRSGFCGSNGTCFRACQFDQDCPQNGGKILSCHDVTIVVEGVMVTASSCIP